MTGHRLLPGTDPRLRVAPWRGDTSVAHLTPGRGRPTPAAVHRALDELAAAGYTSVAHRRARRPRPAAVPPGRVRGARAPPPARPHPRRPAPPSAPADLRRGHHADRAAVLAVDAAAFPPFWRLDGPGLDDALAATPSARFRVASDHGRADAVVGYAVTGRPGPRGYLQRLAVHPDHQRAGLGGALVVDGLRWLRRWGAKEVLVNTQEGNEPAVRLYEALGFQLRPEGWPCSASPSARPRSAAPRRRRAGRAPRRRGLAAGAAPPPAPAAEVPDAGAGPAIELVVADPGRGRRASPSSMTRRASTASPADGSIALDVHQRVRSRSELAQSMEGEGLRCCVFHDGRPAVSTCPPQPDGTRRRRAVPRPAAGGLPLPTEGVYPRRAHRPGRRRQRRWPRLVTHLIVPAGGRRRRPEPGGGGGRRARRAARAAARRRPSSSPGATSTTSRRWSPGSPRRPTCRPPWRSSPRPSTRCSPRPSPATPSWSPSCAAAAAGRTGARRALRARSTSTPWRPPGCSMSSGRSRRAGSAVLRDALGVEPRRRRAARGRRPSAPTGSRCSPTPAPPGWSSTTSRSSRSPTASSATRSPSPSSSRCPRTPTSRTARPARCSALAPDPIVHGAPRTATGRPGSSVSRVLAELALLRLEQPSVARSSVVLRSPRVCRPTPCSSCSRRSAPAGRSRR